MIQQVCPTRSQDAAVLLGTLLKNRILGSLGTFPTTPHEAI